MFHWIPPDRVPQFQQAISVIMETFKDVTNVFAADMLVAIGKNLTFLQDQQFVNSFESSIKTQMDRDLIWRLHTLAWAATHALHVKGDFVECGVWYGFSSAVLCKYLDFEQRDKDFYLYDTFAGLPDETSTVEERNAWNPGYVSNPPDDQLKTVRRTFGGYPNVRIVEGVVPNSFQQAVPDAIAYLHIDMNSAQAELLALQHLFDRVSPGGLIILDDFGWTSNKSQTASQIDFMRQRGYSILELPTGQGLVIKR